MLRYRDYTGRVEYDDDAGVFSGEVVGLRDVVTFEGTSVEELEEAFRESVDDYLAFCEERGEEPDRPFSGRLVLRLTSGLHREAYLRARAAGQSLNEYIADGLAERVRRTG